MQAIPVKKGEAMKSCHTIAAVILVAALYLGLAMGQSQTSRGENAAPWYRAAFAQMQDPSITPQQTKALSLILNGTISYDDSEFKQLVEKNHPALETLFRGASLSNCDWGLDYRRGENVPVDYVQKALALGRINVLYTLHMLIAGDKDSAVRALISGLRFSQNVANGGSIFAALSAKTLITEHIKAATLHFAQLSSSQQTALQSAVKQLGANSVDWQSAVKRDLESLQPRFSRDPRCSESLNRITSSYIATLVDYSMLPHLQQTIAKAPKSVSDVIPNPKRLLEQKQELAYLVEELSHMSAARVR